MAARTFYLVSCLTILQLICPLAFSQTPKSLIPSAPILPPRMLQQEILNLPKTINEDVLKALQADLVLDLEKIQEATMPEGPRTGGGGNGCGLVVQTATEKLEHLLSMNDSLSNLLSANDLSKVLRVMKQAKIYTSNKLLLEGQRKDAINYPALQSIVLDSYFCEAKLSDLSAVSMSVLFHEYLGLTRIDDTRYQISNRFLFKYREDLKKQNKYSFLALDQLKRDEKNQISCFNGKVSQTKRSLIEEDGRKSPDMKFEYDIVEVDSEEPRSFEKYADYYDSTGKQVEYSKATIGKGTQYLSKTFLAIAKYPFATSGSFGTSSKVFKIQITEATPYEFKIDKTQAIGTQKFGAPTYTYDCQEN